MQKKYINILIIVIILGLTGKWVYDYNFKENYFRIATYNSSKEIPDSKDYKIVQSSGEIDYSYLEFYFLKPYSGEIIKDSSNNKNFNKKNLYRYYTILITKKEINKLKKEDKILFINKVEEPESHKPTNKKDSN
jgi:hypothetical protein